ncbi:MAG: hypothetical protein PHV77_06315 [Candidatus Omnitrophica bacterium]|nr:hypothetical protein [Candidatus Omnitrophota bacterium]
MYKRLKFKSDMKCPMITRWQTRNADFMQIEISPVHVLRIKIDKAVKK